MKVELKLNTGRTYIANVPNNFTDEQVINLVNSELEMWHETVEEIISKDVCAKSGIAKSLEEENKVVECTDMTYGRAKRLFDDMCSTIMTYGYISLPKKYDQIFKVMWQKIDESLSSVISEEEIPNDDKL